MVTLSREMARSRRLADGEGAALLAARRPSLRAVVECALETGMRRGEILGLRWWQINGMQIDGTTITWAQRPTLTLAAANTKTRRARQIPISSRLRSLLDLRRFDPAGQPLPADTFVFGNEIGQRVQNIKRAWYRAVLKAHGHTPTYTTGANLTPASRAALAVIDLHFHDLRREAGSRWLEGGVPLHTVKDWLGHTNIAQTSTYLAGTMQTQHDAMRRFEERRGDSQSFATGSSTPGFPFCLPRMAPLYTREPPSPRDCVRRTIVQVRRPSPQPALACSGLEVCASRGFLRHRSSLVSSLCQAGVLALAARQPAGTGSAQIRWSIAPNRRRVRWLSASSSQ